jgi:maltooligosyltrehalose trehalohydrolase
MWKAGQLFYYSMSLSKMKEISIYKRSLGINFNQGGLAEVVVWAPFAHSVAVSLADGTLIPLQAEQQGYWSILTRELAPGTEYGISLDGREPRPDPASLLQRGGVHGLSTAVKLDSFSWSDQNWRNIDLANFVIYELHAGTFTTEGTFAAIEEKLDYLVGLGVTAIELMPVAQFPGDRNWGYDGVFPYAVQNSYGGPEALQHLVNTCHEKGLAVIVDVVYNHLGPEGNYLGEYAPYFTEKYKTPWGGAINFDDAWCDGVRQYFIENTLMWFRDFHIDALRMDAVHAIKDFSPKHILQEIKEYVDRYMVETNCRHYLIVECDLNDTRFIQPVVAGGYGMGAQWNDEFHHALRVASGQKRNGYYADFNGIEHLAKAYRDAYVYDGQYSEERHRSFGIKTKGRPGQQFVVFSQNHDQIGNRMLGERTSTLLSFEMQKLLAGAVMISPYLPLVFMGEEYREPNPFLYFVSHTEPELVEAVRKGRKEEFKSQHGEGEAPDPQAVETFESSKLQWQLLSADKHLIMLNYYKSLISLRKMNSVLKSPDRNGVEATANAKQKILIVKRSQANQRLVCFLNFSARAEKVSLPDLEGNWTKLFDSAASVWGGPGDGPEQLDTAGLMLQPQSIIIYSQQHV